MAWIALVVAGLLEVAWAIGLKHTVGFTKPVPSALTIACIGASMYLLARAAGTIPIGIAYAVWVGIGVAGVALVDSVVLGAPFTWLRGIFLVLLLVALVGLKVTAPPS